MKSKIVLFLFLGMLSVQAQRTKNTAAEKSVSKAVKTPTHTHVDEGIFATITTNKGTIVIQLEYQKTPVTVANFISLVEGTNPFVVDEKLKNKPFYDGLKFHRVIADFMIQGGDPLGTGTGGPGYSFKDEITDLKHDKSGVLSMANSGPTTNGSQFFITHKETPWLDGKHTVFGEVTQGMDVVNKIEQNDEITKITITRKGNLANEFDAVKVFSTYYANKDEEAKKQAAIEAENREKLAAIQAENKKKYLERFAPILKEQADYLNKTKAKATKTNSGLAYSLIKKGTGAKPADNSTIYITYAGYLESGELFDSNDENIAKKFGKYDENRAKQNGYQPFPFQTGKKEGMIPGFLEAIDSMNLGDKTTFFLPANLAYGERGAGNVIPPNSNIIFELEISDKAPTPVTPTTEKK